MLRVLKLAAALWLGVAGTAGAAQDFFMGGSSPMDYSAMSNATMNNAIGNISVGDTARSQSRGYAGRGSATRGQVSPYAAAFARPGSAAALTSEVAPRALTYRVDRAARQQVVRDFAGRLAAKNPEGSREFARMIQRQDPFAAFRSLTSSDGYRNNNAADALAAYLVTAWIVSGGREVQPDAQGTRLIRSRIAAAMLTNPQLSNPATLQQLGDELQILTVIIAAGFNGARKEGRTSAYADEVARMFRSYGGPDLRRLELTPAGFVRR